MGYSKLKKNKLSQSKCKEREITDFGRKKEEIINRKENENPQYRDFTSCF